MPQVDVLFVTAVFIAVHLASPLLAGAIRDPHRFGSFGGGLAVAYVFLHLLPELDDGHELVGARIYFVALGGFTVFYGLQYWLRQRESEWEETGRYAMQMGIAMVYTAMLVFTLANQLPETLALTVVFALSMGLHLLSNDIDAVEEFGDRFRGQGRYLLALAALGGFGLSLMRRPQEVNIDLLTAILAGFMLFSVFRNEVPSIARAHFPAFLLGMTTFLVMHIVLGE